MHRGDAIAGFGIYATRDIQVGEVVFRGEERACALSPGATSSAIGRRRKSKCSAAMPSTGGDVHILWDEDPSE
jgi:hypothetical protein